MTPIPSSQGRYGVFLPAILTVIDVLLINIIFSILVYTSDGDDFHGRQRLAWTLLNIAIFPSCIFYRHDQRSERTEHIASHAVKWVIIHAVFFIPLLLFLEENATPDITFFLKFYGIALISLPVCWIAETRLLRTFRRRGINICKVIIFGTGEPARRLAQEMSDNETFGYRVLGFFDTKRPDDFNGNYIGGIDDIEPFCKKEAVDEIYYAHASEDESLLKKVIQIADNNICKLYYMPMLSSYISHNFTLVLFNGNIPVLTIHPSPLQSLANMALKRMFDIVFSTIFLIISPIIFIPVAIAIKLSSPGPVFFRQTRTGYQGKDFTCYKFRSMKINSDSDKTQASKDDCRTTHVGRILRHYSIDELPQFWNVLKGDMSIVGPRPHMLAHTETYRTIINSYMVRHTIKPGITGWAQVMGCRGATEETWQMKRRVEYDMWYIEHWSFMLDIKIIFKTITNAIGGESNAY